MKNSDTTTGKLYRHIVDNQVNNVYTGSLSSGDLARVTGGKKESIPTLLRGLETQGYLTIHRDGRRYKEIHINQVADTDPSPKKRASKKQASKRRRSIKGMKPAKTESALSQSDVERIADLVVAKIEQRQLMSNDLSSLVRNLRSRVVGAIKKSN